MHGGREPHELLGSAAERNRRRAHGRAEAQVSMSRTTPIVIQLKKRTAPGATPPSEDVDAGAPPDPPPPPPQDDRDKSSSSSPRRDRARVKVGSFASIDSLMDLTSLAALFRKLHEEAGTSGCYLAFAHRESQKLAEQEKRNRQAQTNFKEAFGAARGFLEEFAPDGGLPEPVDDASDGGMLPGQTLL
eukprot:s1478_g3.t1